MNCLDWLFETRTGRIARWLLRFSATVVGFMGALFIIQQTETRFFPVVTQWKLNSIEQVDDTYVVQGEMVTARSCEHLSTSIMAVPNVPLVPRVMLHQIKPGEIIGGHSPVGFGTWGPWAMHIPPAFAANRDKIDRIEIIGHHRCHLLWAQDTVYGSIPVGRIP